jgi:hypothetical protein
MDKTVPERGDRRAHARRALWRRRSHQGSDEPRAGCSPEAPELVLLGQEANGATRTLRLHLASPRRAWRAYLLPSQGVEILAVGEKGSALHQVGNEPFTYSELPLKGVDLTLKVRTSGPVLFTVVDQSNGLSRIPGATLPNRPETVMSAPQPEEFRGYPTFVGKSFVFSKGVAP